MARKRRNLRRKLRLHQRSKAGSAPGMIHPHPDSPKPVIRVTAYNEETFVEQQIEDPAQIQEFLDTYTVTWINVDGHGDAALIKQIGNLFGVHPLALEDVVNVHQRAKVEPYEDHLFIVSRMVDARQQLETEQLSIFLGDKYVLTFQERTGDCLDPVRGRIRKATSRLRRRGPDHLAYALLDAVIDSYFPLTDTFADQLDELEEEVAHLNGPEITAKLHAIRSNLLLLRRAIRPHREAINELIRDEHQLIGQETQVFLRDCYDHTVQLIELLDVYREMCSDLRDYHVSIVNNYMNEVMKVLTIIATIFIPLSFIAGVYGMNFDTRKPGNMPELEEPYGYVFALSLMAAVAGGMIVFFRRRGWIGPNRPDQ